MSNPFIINDLPNGCWSVTWPDFGPIKTFSMKIKAVEVVFNELRFDEVGFGIAFAHEDTDIMWISRHTWLQEVNQNYEDYFHDMYDLMGFVFKSEPEALTMIDWLEKKYVWSILSD